MSELIKTIHRHTPNGVPYTTKIYERPGFAASITVGDPESFSIHADPQMTFHPGEVKEISVVLRVLAEWLIIESMV